MSDKPRFTVNDLVKFTGNDPAKFRGKQCVVNRVYPGKAPRQVALTVWNGECWTGFIPTEDNLQKARSEE